MRQLSITLLMLFVTEALLNVTSRVSTPKPIPGRELKLQNDIKTNKNSEDTKSIDIISEEPDFRAKGPKDGPKKTGQTLEECYGRIGRWISSRSGKKKGMTKERYCCVCCGRPVPDRISKRLRNHRKGLDKCCSHVQVLNRDGSSDVLFGKDVGRLTEEAIEYSKQPSLRPPNRESQADPGFVPDLDRKGVSESVRCDESQKLKILKGSTRGSSASDWDNHRCIFTICCDLCCPKSVYYCCGYTLGCIIGTPIWLIDQGCRCFCRTCLKGLDKCLMCCCG